MQRVEILEKGQADLKRFLLFLAAIGILNLLLNLFLRLFLPNGWHPSTVPPAAPSQNQSVNIGDAGKNKTSPARDFLTTEEVATREAVSARTVLTWIDTGRLTPPPIKNARAWVIPADYRLQPQTTAISGH